MTVDEVVKLMIYTGITFSLVGLTVQLMRILGRFADMLGDLRKSIQNLGEVSTQFVEDYKSISEAIKAISSGVTNLNASVIQPLMKLSKLTSMIPGFGKSKKDKSD